MAVPGTWNIFGFNLPDFGLTEKVADPNNKTFFNPAVNQSKGLSSSGFQSGFQNGSVGGSTQNATGTSGAGGGGGGGSIPASPGARPFDPTRDDINAPQWADYRASQNQKPSNWSGWGIDFGADEEAYRRYPGQVEDAFRGTDDLLNKMEQDTRSGEQNLYNSVSGGYDALKPMLEEQQRSGLASNELQQGQAQQQSANALNEAKRLFSELSQGVQQKFGGSNSAAEFANNFYGREFQRQAGGIQNTLGQNIQTLKAKSEEIKGQYFASIQQLEQQKQAAIAQARDVFQERITQINGMRLQNVQQKAAMKLQELQNLRAISAQIQSQAMAHQQNLEAMTHQANLQLQAQAKDLGQSWTQPAQQQSYLRPVAQAIQAPAKPNAIATAVGSYGVPRKEDRLRMGLA